VGVPTAADFEKWLKEKMRMSLKEFENLPRGAKDLIYIGFKSIWRGNPNPVKEEEVVRAKNKYREILEAVRKAITIEPSRTKEDLYLKARVLSTVPFTYGEFLDTLGELLTWGLIIYRDGRYWR